jgi:hypothetical protein
VGEGGGREKGGGEAGVDPGIGCLFTGSWILDGNKVKIRYTGSGVGMNSLALFFKSLETILTYNLDAAIRYSLSVISDLKKKILILGGEM